MAGSGKAGKISYIGTEPSFIKKFKEKVGYKEEVTVAAKREAAAKYREDREDGSDHSDREDERPQVVVMAPGDLTKSEADRLGAFSKTEETEAPADGKIRFKKPTKRSSDTDSELHASTKKKKAETTETTETVGEDKSRKEKKTKVKQKNLLSFDDEEDDDG